MKYVLRIDKQGRVLLPKLLREAVGIETDSEIGISRVRIREGVEGLLIERKEGKYEKRDRDAGCRGCHPVAAGG